MIGTFGVTLLLNFQVSIVQKHDGISTNFSLLTTMETVSNFWYRMMDGTTYKLFASWTYGGKNDQDMNAHNPHTITKLKMVSLYDFMLGPFKNKGHCVVMDSAYMGDGMVQVGWEVWEINVVDTIQSNQTGGGGGSFGVEAIKQKEIQKGTHECLIYEHNSKSLPYAIWANNNFMMALSNFHPPAILQGGIKRRKWNVERKRRDRDLSDVDCPAQQQTYCETSPIGDWYKTLEVVPWQM